MPRRFHNRLLHAGVLLAALSSQAFAAVAIVSMRPSLRTPQPIGTSITWTVKATDTGPGPLTFRFDVAAPDKAFALARDYNLGILQSGTWTAHPFVWSPTSCSDVTEPSGVVALTCEPVEGIYQIQVSVKDFASGETASQTVRYQVKPLVSGTTPVAIATANSLVAWFSAPACPAGSSMRVSFQEQSGGTPAATTQWLRCHAPHTMTFQIAGMYPATTYSMFAQTLTGGHIANGPAVSYTTGSLPAGVAFPAFKVVTPPGANTDTADSLVMYSVSRLHGAARYPQVAADLTGNVLWYYDASATANSDILTRPLANGTFLSIQSGSAWNPISHSSQILRQLDLAGNIIRETNMGVIQQQLLAMGVTDAQPCNTIPHPAPIGSACLGVFHHELMQTLPNGYSAVLADVEKIFPPGTQGDPSRLPVDIIGDMIIVLDANWQVSWYFDAFEHADGAPQLDINRPAVLSESCTAVQSGCPQVFLLGSGISPHAKDWLHANSIYYWPSDSQTGVTGDLIWSSRHQDWILKVDYQDGAGTGNILWRMGLDGDFSFNNLYNDSWPWFSHQHEVGIEDNGAGVMTVFDNGNTRVSAPPLGLGKGHSRGMALDFDETGMQVTPVLTQNLGAYAAAMGSAQLLTTGNYYFLPAIVFLSVNDLVSDSLELLPTAGTDTAVQVWNLQGPESYRAWRMSTLYDPPVT
jgi:arylsulfate sulfotransferase